MSGILTAISRIGSTSAALSGVTGSISSSAGSNPDLLSLLHPASWNGVAFGVLAGTISPGRQTAIHEYPFRDTQWIEDMGRGKRAYSITGFLLAYDLQTLAGPLDPQRTAMIAACERPGPGVLVHPQLGRRTVSLIGGCQMNETWDHGGLIELTFQFLQGVPGPIYPSAATSSTGQVTTAAAAANTATAGDFASDVVGAVESGAAAVAEGVATVQAFANQALSVVGGAQRIVAATTGLVGSFGRYSNGNVLQAQPLSATVASLLAASTTARTLVASTGAAAVASAQLI